MSPTFPEEDFAFRSHYVRVLDGESGDHCICMVSQQWCENLVKQNRRGFTLQEPHLHPILIDAEVSLLLNQQSSPQIQPPWERLELFRVNLNPAATVQRLRQMDFSATSTVSSLETDVISLLQNRIQFLHVRKRYDKCIQGILAEDVSPDTEVAADVVRDLCALVLHCPFLDFSGQSAVLPYVKTVPNILQPEFVACLMDHFVIALPFRPFTLTSCLRFSPSLLTCDSAKYFVLYQILQAISRFQDQDFFVGNITLDDFSIREDLWLEFNPVTVFRALSTSLPEKGTKECIPNGSETGSLESTCKISEWTTLWCLGKISNYDYLLALNSAAGRTFGHPDYHPIFPWVVDFTSPDGGWRDLTKSKYRLTKGDRQLDLTYETTEAGMIAHHIPETFSDLTFYIYNARRVPKSILCQHVRKRWVPAEYPSTLERLYKWSPDECIPDFYSDPDIFQSIHADLPDLGLPSWCENTEDFLTFHRQALESPYVTSNLHHWIDLNFGYKLSGEAAVAAKNVVLSLNVAQKHLKSHGIQQLFCVPHPPAFRAVPWFERESQPVLEPRRRKAKEISGDSASVSSLEMEDVVVEIDGDSANFKFNGPTEIGPIEELENLECLMDFCMAVDSSQPDILADYVSIIPTDVKNGHLNCLQTDLHAFACCALQIFCVSQGSANWPFFDDIKARRVYSLSRLASFTGSLGKHLASALKGILDDDVFPYSARQILSRHDRVLSMPDYLSSLYQFVCSLDSGVIIANLDALETVLEEMNSTDMDIIATFILQRITSASNRYKFATQLLDPVLKYFGPAKSSEVFLPCLHRLYNDFPAASSPDHAAYLQLFEVDFLRAMLVRFGGDIFMRSLTVPLIEKLTDLQELVGTARNGVDFAVGDGFIEDIFAVDVEEKQSEQSPWCSSIGRREEEAAAQNRALSALIWLAEKVGPLLTARFISGNLLKSLALCYTEEEKLKTIELDSDCQEELVQKLNVKGDLSAWIVSDTLIQIASLFGHCFIWDQYLCYCAELVKDALRRLTPMNEAGLLGCMELIPQILPHVSDAALREHLPFQLINDILYPVVELLTSFCHIFPSGTRTRRLLAGKWLNLVLGIAQRIGRDSAQEFITRPLLVTFFGVFTQLYGSRHSSPVGDGISVPKTTENTVREADQEFGSPFVSIRKDAESGELTIGTPVRISAIDSPTCSPTPPVPTNRSSYDSGDNEEVLKELRGVFTETLAFDAYIPFCKLLGQFHMDEKLLNNDLLHEISISNPNRVQEKPSQSLQIPPPRRLLSSSSSLARSQSAKFDPPPGDSSDGLMLSRSFHPSTPLGTGMTPSASAAEVIGEDEALFAEVREAACDRTLRGNWLAYWQHELGQGRRDEPWNIKQIPLQTFSAHSGPVKSICILDCEYSFMTASKDKTVRLWSIRNCGEGSLVSQADGLYLEHKRPVTDLRFLSRERLAASSDGVVNLWDPWTLATVSRIEVVSQANFIDCSAAPSSVLFVGHLTDETCFVSRFDVRCRMGPCGTGQFQVSPNSPGILRCLVVSPDDAWFACGFSSGVISVFDQRTGIMSATWKPYESDVLQLIPVSGSILTSVGSDGTVYLWDLKREVDDRLVGAVRGFPEPIFQSAFGGRASGGDLITLMANNRIGVVADLLRDGTSVTTSKIRHESLKGNFSTLAVLPMNRQVLVGNETGSTLLMC